MSHDAIQYGLIVVLAVCSLSLAARAQLLSGAMLRSIERERERLEAEIAWSRDEADEEADEEDLKADHAL